MSRRTAAFAFLAGLALVVWAARAPAVTVPPPLVCADWATLAERLNRLHGERPDAAGLAAEGGLTVLFLARDGETYTLVQRLPGGMACILAVGRDWLALGRRRGKPT